MFAAVCVVLAATGHVLMSGAPVPTWALAGALLAAGGLGWACGAGERRPATVAGLTVAVQAALHLGFTRAQSATRAPGTGEVPAVRQWADHVLCGADPGSAAAVRAYEIALRAGLLRPGGVGGGPSAPAAHHLSMDPTGSADPVGSTESMTSMAHDMAVGMPGMPGGTYGGIHDGMHTAGAHLMAHATGTASLGMLIAHLVAAALCGLWLAQGERAAFALVRACADRAFVPLRLVLAVLLPPEAPAPPRRLRERARRPRPRPHVHAFTTRGPPGVPAVL
jgi:hypothetical protein